MAKPNTTFLYNNTANDGANSGNAAGGAGAGASNWVVIDLVNDALWWLDSQQADADPADGAIYPVIIPGAGSIEAPKTFVKDASQGTAGLLDQVPLAGTTAGGQSGGDTRYVFAIYFDGVTAGIPYLEAWNDNTHAASDHELLGAGTPANSTYIAIATTAAAPGSATWTGTPLAGSGSRISLAAAALAGAQNVYFNIRRAIASTLSAQDATGIVLSLRYLYS